MGSIRKNKNIPKQPKSVSFFDYSINGSTAFQETTADTGYPFPSIACLKKTK